MELKQKLQDYTRAEFKALVEKIFKVDMPEQEHDNLIRHFDQIVEHPQGADLLFYPNSEDDIGPDGADGVLYTLDSWYRANNLSAFSDPPLQRPTPSVAAPSSATDRAIQASSANLAKVEQIAVRVGEARQKLELGFASLEQVLSATELAPSTASSTLLPREEFERLEDSLAQLESAQRTVNQAMHSFDSLERVIQLAKDDATRSLSYRHLDSTLQATVMQRITDTSEQ